MNWVVRSKEFPEYRVLVADCSQEHALSVYKSLKLNEHTPNDLSLAKEKGGRWFPLKRAARS